MPGVANTRWDLSNISNISHIAHASEVADVSDMRQRINLSWLIRLRWGAVLGQFIAVLAVSWLLHVSLPMTALLVVLTVTVVSNAAVAVWARRATAVPQWVVGGVLVLDVVQLTELLYFSGGSTNPFNFLYLIHVALAAVTLDVAWMVALVMLSTVCFAGLFWVHVPLSAHGAEVPSTLHAQGTAVAFVLAAGFIVYFVHRVTMALRQKEGELLQAREASARNTRLTSLATLVAGAAHELATPLATIAVVSKELERSLEGNGACVDDARLIRHEVGRCRDVLARMASDAGQSAGEAFTTTTPGELLEQALGDLRDRDRVTARVGDNAAPVRLCIPQRTIAQGLRAVVKNALEASSGRVHVDVNHHDSMCIVAVQDFGTGMSPDVLSRVGEPFFTTKGPGRGMGLGVFLIRTVLERLGGALELRSVVNEGTRVVLRIPICL